MCAEKVVYRFVVELFGDGEKSEYSVAVEEGEGRGVEIDDLWYGGEDYSVYFVSQFGRQGKKGELPFLCWCVSFALVFGWVGG